MQFAYKDTNNSISKHQLISHLQTPRTNTELDYEIAPQQPENSNATQKKICDYSPNSQTFFKPVDVVNTQSVPPPYAANPLQRPSAPQSNFPKHPIRIRG